MQLDQRNQVPNRSGRKEVAFQVALENRWQKHGFSVGYLKSTTSRWVTQFKEDYLILSIS